MVIELRHEVVSAPITICNTAVGQCYMLLDDDASRTLFDLSDKSRLLVCDFLSIPGRTYKHHSQSHIEHVVHLFLRNTAVLPEISE